MWSWPGAGTFPDTLSTPDGRSGSPTRHGRCAIIEIRPGGPTASSRGRVPRSGTLPPVAWRLGESPGRGDRCENVHPLCRPSRGSLNAYRSTGGSAAARLALPFHGIEPGYWLSPLRGSLLLFHSFTDPPHMAASNSDLQPG